MTTSLYSPQWYRVAGLCPRLRAQVRVQRQQWRGQRWYVLSDTATGRQHRINAAAYQFIGRCDGQHSVQAVWQALLDAQTDTPLNNGTNNGTNNSTSINTSTTSAAFTAPSQDEVLQLLGQLNELELLHTDQPANSQAVAQRGAERQSARRRGMLNPFSFRLPLGDPQPWLSKLDGLSTLIFQPWVGAVWLLLMLLTLLAVGSEWPALRAQVALPNFGASDLWLAVLVYPLMKAVHELAHAMAVRRWGGEVHEAGIGLLFLVPAPYVDASAATAFASRAQRAMVGAAGIVVELSLAAIAFVLWCSTQAGVVHSLALGVMLIGAGSTLLFNGNPLLRFDAYFVMCDLLDLPNLAARSNAWWSHQLGRLLLGSRGELPTHARSERPWLWLYALASWVYRLLLSLGLVLWLGAQWWLLGVAAALYMAFSVVLRPLWVWARQATQRAQPGAELARLRLRLALCAGAVLVLVFVLPLPLSTVAPAVVWLPENAQVRPEVDGFIKELPVADGAQVQVGDVLLSLHNPELLSQFEQLSSRLEGLRVEQFQQLLRDPHAAQNLVLDVERLQAEVQRLQERITQLQVRATAAGTLSMPRQSDLLGAYLKQGHTVAYVLAPEALRVRAAVSESDAHLVRSRWHQASVRLAEQPDRVFVAARGADVPSSTRILPSAALGDVGGGPYATDPAEKDGRHSLAPVFLVDLKLQNESGLELAAAGVQRAGGRAWVRIDHGTEPLVLQAYRRASQLFLQHFAPSA
jgi:putative peptide zinc metalloprotease protein